MAKQQRFEFQSGRAAPRGGACVKKKIEIINPRTGEVIADFMGRKGPGCGPRPKPSTAHLRVHKRAMAQAARACKGTKRGKFRACVSRQLRK